MWKKTPTAAVQATIVATIPTTNRSAGHYSPPPTIRREFIALELNHQNGNDGLPTYEQVIKINHQMIQQSDK